MQLPESVWIALISAASANLLALISAIASIWTVRVSRRTEKQSKQTERNTNGIQDARVEAVRELAYRDGHAAGRAAREEGELAGTRDT